MRSLIFTFIAVTILFSCNTTTPPEDVEPTPDSIPEEQDIVYVDTSGLTGKLTVYSKYYDSANQINNAPDGTSISLYATYEDLQNGLSLYNVFTTSDSAYFGFINYGNYYVSSNASVDTNFYYGDAAIQIRPDRTEKLTITMY